MTVYITATASALPARVRRQDDPIFNGIRHQATGEQEIFAGMRESRVLVAEDSIETLMEGAARQAMRNAGLSADNLDALLGWADPSPFYWPNLLFELHRRMRLAPRVQILPEPALFANFICALRTASRLIRCGEAHHALLAFGAAYSTSVDYTMPHSVTVGDGAAAVVVSDRAGRFKLMDFAHRVMSDAYGELAFHFEPERLAPHPVYRVSAAGVRAILDEGISVPVEMVNDLLQRHGIAPSQTSLIAHQASTRLSEAWAVRMNIPVHHTFERLGNLAFVSVPLNLDLLADQIKSRYLVLLQIGLGNQFQAALLENAV